MTPARLSRKARKAETREAILVAATRLFARRGIAATSLDQIAESVGLTKGAIYGSFPSKRALVAAVAQRVSVPLDFEPLFQARLTLKQRLRLLGRGLVQVQRTVSKELVLLDLEYTAEEIRNPRVHRNARDRHHAAITALADRLRAVARERNETLPLEPRELIALITAIGQGIIHRLARQPGSITPRGIETVFESIVGGESGE